jgi:hypothetical protein
MKLETYLMHEALTDKAWDKVIDLLCQHFRIVRPCSEYEVRSGEAFIEGVAIVQAVPGDTYSWTTGGGFGRAPTMMATTPRITVWRKT